MKTKTVIIGVVAAAVLIVASKPVLDWYGRGQDTRAAALVNQALSDATQKAGHAPADLTSVLNDEAIKRLKRLGVEPSQIRYSPLPDNADNDAPLFTIERHGRTVEVRKGGAVLTRRAR